MNILNFSSIQQSYLNNFIKNNIISVFGNLVILCFLLEQSHTQVPNELVTIYYIIVLVRKKNFFFYTSNLVNSHKSKKIKLVFISNKNTEKINSTILDFFDKSNYNSLCYHLLSKIVKQYFYVNIKKIYLFGSEFSQLLRIENLLFASFLFSLSLSLTQQFFI